jgi:hypothetical protein
MKKILTAILSIGINILISQEGGINNIAYLKINSDSSIYPLEVAKIKEGALYKVLKDYRKIRGKEITDFHSHLDSILMPNDEFLIIGGGDAEIAYFSLKLPDNLHLKINDTIKIEIVSGQEHEVGQFNLDIYQSKNKKIKGDKVRIGYLESNVYGLKNHFTNELIIKKSNFRYLVFEVADGVSSGTLLKFNKGVDYDYESPKRISRYKSDTIFYFEKTIPSSFELNQLNDFLTSNSIYRAGVWSCEDESNEISEEIHYSITDDVRTSLNELKGLQNIIVSRGNLKCEELGSMAIFLQFTPKP